MTLDLIHPCYVDGVLTTTEGGVLCGENLRIQAWNIEYTRQLDATPPVYTLFAEGDLLIDYCDYTIVGDCISYNFITQEGCITGGKTAFAPWYVGGERIFLKSNGDLVVENGYITTSEGGEDEILLTADEITLTNDSCLDAKGIRFRIKDVPVFYFPFLSLDLKSTPHSPFSVTAGWGGFLGPYLSVRYHLCSLKNWDIFLRGDAYWNKGWGAGIETEYESDVRCESLYTRSYYAHDISIDDPKRRDRYRFQGCYDFSSCDDRGYINLIYDILSDDEMANDFPPYKFELGTAGKTELTLHRQSDFWTANLFTNVRVNSFQSINQELPTFELSLLPFEIGPTGVIAENLFRGSYLSYVFSDNVRNADDFAAWRFEFQPRIYRPFLFGPVRATPEAALIGIGYSNSPESGAVGQAVGDFNLRLETNLSRCYEEVKHVLQPYAHYHLYTAPTVPVGDYYVFSIKDGYNDLNLVKLGLKNAFFISPFCSQIALDLWTNVFLDTENTLPQSIPKGYLNLDYKISPKFFLGIDSAWNFAHKQVDFYNARGEFAFSENLAVAFEYRHRGRFDWRKADFYNFVLEATRTEEELLASPLSDRRDIILAKLFYRFHPDWDLGLQFRHGWNRLVQPSYTEYRITLGKIIFGHYLIRFTYERRGADNRYSLSFKLNPSPP